MRPVKISLPTKVDPMDPSRLATGVGSKWDDAKGLHVATWRGLLQDFAESEKHPSIPCKGAMIEEPEWHGLSGTWSNVKGRVARLALQGWTQASTTTASMFRQVVAQHTGTFLQTVEPTEEPGDVDVGAYLADAELQFTSATPSRLVTLGNGGVVTFEHELFSSSSVASSDIVQRGVMVAACVYMLERAGVRCEVIVRLTGSGIHEPYPKDHQIKVKEAADVMHVGRLLYWLAHPSVHRVVLFSVRMEHWAETSYSSAHREPIAAHHIKTLGQESTTRLDQWLATVLKSIGLTLK